MRLPFAMRRRLPRCILTAALFSSAALALLPSSSSAQQTCPSTGGAPSQSWAPPLDRNIAVRARDVSLREALDRVAAAAHFRVSYSGDFLPLDRRVCVSSDSISAGDALATLLQGVSVTSVVTAADQVVIAPAREASQDRGDLVQTLDRVVVTGSATGNAQRPLSIAVDVLDGRRLDQRSSGSFTTAMDAGVAGM